MTRRGNLTTVAQVEHSYDPELNKEPSGCLSASLNMIRESWTSKFVLRAEAYPSYRKIV